MEIQKNKERALEFIKKYSDYESAESLISSFSDKLTAKYNENVEKQNDIEIHKMMLEFEKQMMELKEKNRKIETEIKKEIKLFSQELLTTIYDLTEISEIKEMIRSQAFKNDCTIKNLNNLYLESGFIFEYLDKLTKKDKIRLLKLRESDHNLILGNLQLRKLSPEVRGYVFKSINGNLEKERQSFMEQHHINSEKEFDFYKDCTMKSEGRK